MLGSDHQLPDLGDGLAADSLADHGGPDDAGGDADVVPDGVPSDAADSRQLTDSFDTLPDGGDSIDDDTTPDCPPDPLDPDGDGLDNQTECQLGTNPDAPDSDLDGVWDVTEVLDGTDPTNPASALAWRPELAYVHPRLYFDAAGVAGLKLRWENPTPEQADLKARVAARCSETALPWPADGSFDIGVSRQHGYVAAACAFQGLMLQDTEALTKAVDLMSAAFPDPSYLGEGLLIPKAEYGLAESEGLVAWCSAYDYLSGAVSGDASFSQAASLSQPMAQARERLLQRLGVFRKLMHKDAFWVMAVTSQNNHVLKAFAAFGLCAMAINDTPEAAFDLNEAVAGMTYTFTKFQSVPQGGYGEGWNYLTYGADSFLPFMVAYHRFAKGQPLPYWNPSSFTDKDPLAGTVFWYQDFVTHPVFRSVFEKALWSTAPNGLMVNTDDANPSPLHGALLAWLFQDGRYLWNWNLPAVGRYSGSSPEVSFALLDGVQQPQPPNWPLDVSLPEAGFAILRQGFEANDVMLVVQGEHGTVNGAGGGHEHPDPTSFLLHAFGEYLVLDPGYINFELHDLVKKGEDHNVVLVDGLGPEMVGGYLPKTEGFITEFQQDVQTTSVQVTATYRGVQVTRSIVRPGDSGLFVVADTLLADKGHTYTFQLNGNGGVEVGTSFALQPDGASYSRPNASVRIYTWALEGPVTEYTSHPEEHATTWGEWSWHQMFQASATMADGAGFLSLVVPTPSGEQGPEVTLLHRGGGAALARVQGEGTTWLVLHLHPNVTAGALPELDAFVPDVDLLLPGVHVMGVQ